MLNLNLNLSGNKGQIRWFEGHIYDTIKVPRDHDKITLVPALVQCLRLENISVFKLPLGGALNCDDVIKQWSIYDKRRLYGTQTNVSCEYSKNNNNLTYTISENIPETVSAQRLSAGNKTILLGVSQNNWTFKDTSNLVCRKNIPLNHNAQWLERTTGLWVTVVTEIFIFNEF